MKEIDFKQIKETVDNSDKILIGIGEETDISAKEVYETLNRYITDKDYFVVYMAETEELIKGIFKDDRCEKAISGIQNDDIGVKGNLSNYMKWLTMTLNKKLIVIELGAGFLKPQFLRWPFEKIVCLNNKAELIRVNNRFPQISIEIADKATAVHMSPEEFIEKLCL